MRKTLVIIVAVAMLGVIAAYLTVKPNDNTASSPTISVAAATPTAKMTTNLSDSTPTPTATTSSSHLTDGTYTGSDMQNRYGDVQVKITVSGGKITDVIFMRVPNEDPRSQEINDYATPLLRSQTLTAQSANISGVSGASHTSQSYISSLQSAIDKAMQG